MNPTTRTEFAETIKRRLGHPVIVVNVATDQISDAIDEALQFFQKYHCEGSEEVYIAHQMTQNDLDSKVITLDSDVVSVTKVFNTSNSSLSTSDLLFDFNYQFLSSNAYGWTQFGGMGDFVIAKQYLAEIEAIVKYSLPFRYKEVTKKLHLDFNVKSNFLLNQYILINGYKKLDPDEYDEIWSQIHLINLATAYLKRQWGLNLSKFKNLSLPAGVKLNGEELYVQANREIQKAEQDILDHQEPLGIYSL